MNRYGRTFIIKSSNKTLQGPTRVPDIPPVRGLVPPTRPTRPCHRWTPLWKKGGEGDTRRGTMGQSWATNRGTGDICTTDWSTGSQRTSLRGRHERAEVWSPRSHQTPRWCGRGSRTVCTLESGVGSGSLRLGRRIVVGHSLWSLWAPVV